MEEMFNNMDNTWIAAEPAADNIMRKYEAPINYDKIERVGPQSANELLEDIRLAEREMKDSSQWDTLSNFLTDFKQSHVAWFK